MTITEWHFLYTLQLTQYQSKWLSICHICKRYSYSNTSFCYCVSIMSQKNVCETIIWPKITEITRRKMRTLNFTRFSCSIFWIFVYLYNIYFFYSSLRIFRGNCKKSTIMCAIGNWLRLKQKVSQPNDL